MVVRRVGSGVLGGVGRLEAADRERVVRRAGRVLDRVAALVVRTGVVGGFLYRLGDLGDRSVGVLLGAGAVDLVVELRVDEARRVLEQDERLAVVDEDAEGLVVGLELVGGLRGRSALLGDVVHREGGRADALAAEAGRAEVLAVDLAAAEVGEVAEALGLGRVETVVETAHVDRPGIGLDDVRPLALLAVGENLERGGAVRLAVVAERDVELRPRVVVRIGRVGVGHELGVVGPAVVVQVGIRVEEMRIELEGHLPLGGHAVPVVEQFAERGLAGRVEDFSGIDLVEVDAAVAVRVGLVEIGSGLGLHPGVETVAVEVAVDADGRRRLGRIGRDRARGRLALHQEPDDVVGRDEVRRDEVVPRHARVVPERVGERNLEGGGVPADERRAVEGEAHGLALVVGLVSVEVHPAEEPGRALDHVGVVALGVADEVRERHREGVGLHGRVDIRELSDVAAGGEDLAGLD